MMHVTSRVFGVDLGTSKTCIARDAAHLLLTEQSAVAVTGEGEKRKLHTVGDQAEALYGRAPQGITVEHPLVAGRIEDVVLAQAMLKSYLLRADPMARFLAPGMLVSAPGCCSPTERRAVEEVALNAGARRVAVVNEAIAAAVGAGLDIFSPLPRLVIDIGAGTTEIAVLVMGEVIACQSLRVAGRDFDAAIRDMVAERKKLEISLREAERLKITAAHADSKSSESVAEARGRSLINRLPRSEKITARDLSRAIAPGLDRIGQGVLALMQVLPAETISDVMASGAMLTGGGAGLGGVAAALTDRCKLPMAIADDPRHCTVRGLARMASERRRYAGLVKFTRHPSGGLV